MDCAVDLVSSASAVEDRGHSSVAHANGVAIRYAGEGAGRIRSITGRRDSRGVDRHDLVGAHGARGSGRHNRSFDP
jgi:hypothetical protein